MPGRYQGPGINRDRPADALCDAPTETADNQNTAAAFGTSPSYEFVNRLHIRNGSNPASSASVTTDIAEFRMAHPLPSSSV